MHTQGNYRIFSERWPHTLLLTEWDRLCSADRRRSSGGKGESRAAESRFFEDRWGQVVSATFGGQRPCGIVCVVSQQFWDWTQFLNVGWLGTSGADDCLEEMALQLIPPPLLHVAELRLSLESWVNLRQCEVLWYWRYSRIRVMLLKSDWFNCCLCLLGCILSNRRCYFSGWWAGWKNILCSDPWVYSGPILWEECCADLAHSYTSQPQRLFWPCILYHR